LKEENENYLVLNLKLQGRIYGTLYVVGEIINKNANRFKHIFVKKEKINDKIIEKISSIRKTIFITIKFGIKNLPSLGLFVTQNPFFIISRIIRGKRQRIYISEAKSNEDSPIWRNLTVPLSHWCNGNLYEILICEVYNFDTSKKKSYYGEFSFKTIELFDVNKKKFQLEKKIGRDQGLIENLYMINRGVIADQKIINDINESYLFQKKFEKSLFLNDHDESNIKLNNNEIKLNDESNIKMNKNDSIVQKVKNDNIEFF
jgi:hypothetical protein